MTFYKNYVFPLVWKDGVYSVFLVGLVCGVIDIIDVIVFVNVCIPAIYIVLGRIDTAIGQARLLIRERFKQFSKLCDGADVSFILWTYAEYMA